MCHYWALRFNGLARCAARGFFAKADLGASGVLKTCGSGTAQFLAAACAESTNWTADLAEVFGMADREWTGAALHDALEQFMRHRASCWRR
jgi:hypothetical protein